MPAVTLPNTTLAIEPVGLDGAEEELRAVGAGASVGHGQSSGASVLEGEVLVLELGAVDGLAAGTVVVGEVTALAHEVGDDTVEGGALEAEALLAGAQDAEVLRGLGHDVGAQLHHNATQVLAACCHLEEDLWKYCCRHAFFPC